jgi:hypothetical protein
MMELLIPALAALVAGGVGFRMWYARWRRRRTEQRRKVEAPNSYHSSQAVRNQEDRERWGRIDLPGLHPLNRDEVTRLLALVDASSVAALGRKDRQFLDNLTLARRTERKRRA